MYTGYKVISGDLYYFNEAVLAKALITHLLAGISRMESGIILKMVRQRQEPFM